MKKKDGIKNLEKGLLWWFTRIIPFLIIYLLVKTSFFMGYFEVFGNEDMQILAHDFFNKLLVTICLFVTYVSFKRYFLSFFELIFQSSIGRIFESFKEGREATNIFSKVLLYMATFFVILIVLNLWLSSQIKWFNELLKSTSILVLSFVAGLFTSSILGNVIAYEIIAKRRDVDIGDRVKINEIYGDVESIDLFYTHVKNLDNEVLSVPNLTLLTKGIKNFSKMKTVVIHSDISLTHGTDFKKAKKIILDAVGKTDGVLKTKGKEPHMWIKEFTGWTIKCEIRAYTNNVKEKDQIKYEMTENILIALNKEGITTGRS